MSTEPPSLAARLEQTGPLSWREAARLTARVARLLDRVHAQRPAHGGIEPLTVLFVGGTLRLADPLPPASKQAAFVDPRLAAGAEADRQSDFYALGRTMAAMVADTSAVPDECEPDRLPPPLAAVQRRLVAAGPSATYHSGNEIAAALELALAASEGFAEPQPRPVPVPPVAEPPAPLSAGTGPAATGPALTGPAATGPTDADSAERPSPDTVVVDRLAADPPTAAPDFLPQQARRVRVLPGRHRPRLVFALAALLLVGGLAVVLLRQEGNVPVEKPTAAGDPPPMAASTIDDQSAATAADEPAASPPDPAGELPLDQVLAALPNLPTAALPAPPPSSTEVQSLLGELSGYPCTRLEVEPTSLGLRLVGSTAGTTTRTELLARIATLDGIDKVTLALDEAGTFCRLYDLLAAQSEPHVPRLADLFPSRPDDLLAAGEPLVLRVLTPSAPRHLAVDYFTADGMVVHLRTAEPGAPALPPAEAVWIGDPADGQQLTVSAPFGSEVVSVIASAEPLFSAARPMIESAEAYLDALAAALAAQPEKPEASTIAIRTVPMRR